MNILGKRRNKHIFIASFTSVFKEKKTGVGICQEQIVRAFHEMGIDFQISAPKNDIYVKRYLIQNPWIKEHVVYEREIGWISFLKKPPIELVFGYQPVCFAAARYRYLLPCKRMVLIHDMMTMRYPEYYTQSDLDGHGRMFRLAQKAQLIFAVSQTTKKDIIRYLHIPPKRIKVVYNGIDECFFRSKTQKISSNIDFDRDYYIYIGAMRKNKNLINAVKGFETYLMETGADVYFYIAGSKSHEYITLQSYVDSKPLLRKRVLFLGYISEEEKVQLYRQAKALLFVSEYEGFGIPIIEAFASRIPVVTSNCSSMKEIGEGHAVLVDPFSPKSIAEGLKMAENCKKDLIEKNYQYAKQFTWRRVAEKYYKAILKV